MIKFTPSKRQIRDERKLFDAVKAIIYQKEKQCSWNELPSKFNIGSAYYYFKCWQRENKLDEMFSNSRPNKKSSIGIKIKGLESISRKKERIGCR